MVVLGVIALVRFQSALWPPSLWAMLSDLTAPTSRTSLVVLALYVKLMNVRMPSFAAPATIRIAAMLALAALGLGAESAHAQLAPAEPAPAQPLPAPESPPPGSAVVDTPPGPGPQAPVSPFEAAVAPFNFEQALVSETGLTVDHAAKAAVARSPQIAAAEATATGAEWDARVQWSGVLPQVQGYATYRRIMKVENQLSIPGIPSDPETEELFTQPLDNYLLGAGVRVPLSDIFLRVWHLYRSVLEVADARKLQADATVLTVDLQARTSFYAYVLALANRAVFDQALKQADAQRAQIQLFVDAGTAAPVDLMTAVSRVEAARSALARSEGVVATTRNTLSTYSGIPLAQIDKVSEPLGVPQGPSQTSEELVKRGIDRRPELKALRKLVGATEQSRKAEIGGALPQVSVEGNVLYAQPNPRYIPPNRNQFKTSWDVSATLSWTPNATLVGYQRTQRADAEKARARGDLYAFEDQVRIEVVQAYEDYKAAEAAAQAVEAQLKAAEEAYRVRLAMYRVGAGVVIDLLQADLRVTEARLALASAAIDARVALARLNRAAVLKD